MNDERFIAGRRRSGDFRNGKAAPGLAVRIEHGDGVPARRQGVQVARRQSYPCAAGIRRVLLRADGFAVNLDPGVTAPVDNA